MDLAEHVLNQWLAWRPSDAAFRKYRDSQIEAPDAEKAADYLPFECSIEAGMLVPHIVSVRALLIQGVFEHWKKLQSLREPGLCGSVFHRKEK
jgi:hypothetical protein